LDITRAAPAPAVPAWVVAVALMDALVFDPGRVAVLYGQVVAIMNPFTAVNNFITLTEGMERHEAREVVEKAMTVVLLLGTIFVLAGRLILEFYHLSLAALRFGGGVLLFYIAIDMLSGTPKSKQVEPGELAVVPLATPMIVGPGTMTLLIHLGTTEAVANVMAAFLLGALTVAVALYASGLLVRALGRTGVKAMARFMAIIIAAVAAEMLHSAMAEWYSSLHRG
jgi:multiple antibiotic resistance protein